MPDLNFPSVELELVEALERYFTENSITPRHNIKQIMYTAGRESVVKFLRVQHLLQQKQGQKLIQGPEVRIN